MCKPRIELTELVLARDLLFFCCLLNNRLVAPIIAIYRGRFDWQQNLHLRSTCFNGRNSVMMYQNVKRTCRAIVFAFKPIVLCRSRCCRRRGCFSSLIKNLKATEFPEFFRTDSHRNVCNCKLLFKLKRMLVRFPYFYYTCMGLYGNLSAYV